METFAPAHQTMLTVLHDLRSVRVFPRASDEREIIRYARLVGFSKISGCFLAEGGCARLD
jgi:hypothetical protein